MEPGEQFSGARQGVRYRGVSMMTIPHYNDEPGQMHLIDDSQRHGEPGLRPTYPESTGYGEHTAERRHDPTQWNGQMALPGMPKPTDPHLHRLRQANPNLNDFQFKTNGGESPSRVTAHDAAGNRVGVMKLGHQRDQWDSHTDHREVEEIAVAPDHAGKGVGEAMYDLARMRGTKILHSYERSESGESFARRVGGPRLDRKRGHGSDDYLGLDPERHKV